VADIPGLVEGASSGRGLGHRFLRHIVRCRALVLVVDLSVPDPGADLATLREELAAYDDELAARPAVVVGTKTDLVHDPTTAIAALPEGALPVSSMTGDGIDDLLALLGLLARETEAVQPDRRPYVVLRPGRPRFTVTREGPHRWRVAGRSVERWVMEADLEDEHDLDRLQKRMVKDGVERTLVAQGARHGDEVQILDRIFEFLPDPAAASLPDGVPAEEG
jgi:GTPase